MKSEIQSVVSVFFREDEIMTAKQVIIQHVPTSLASAIQSCTRKRIGDSKADRSVEDILNIVCIRPQVTLSIPLGGRLPLLSARPVVTPTAFTRWSHTVAHIRFQLTTHLSTQKG